MRFLCLCLIGLFSTTYSLLLFATPNQLIRSPMGMDSIRGLFKETIPTFRTLCSLRRLLDYEGFNFVPYHCPSTKRFFEILDALQKYDLKSLVRSLCPVTLPKDTNEVISFFEQLYLRPFAKLVDINFKSNAPAYIRYLTFRMLVNGPRDQISASLPLIQSFKGRWDILRNMLKSDNHTWKVLDYFMVSSPTIEWELEGEMVKILVPFLNDLASKGNALALVRCFILKQRFDDELVLSTRIQFLDTTKNNLKLHSNLLKFISVALWKEKAQKYLSHICDELKLRYDRTAGPFLMELVYLFFTLFNAPDTTQFPKLFYNTLNRFQPSDIPPYQIYACAKVLTNVWWDNVFPHLEKHWIKRIYNKKLVHLYLPNELHDQGADEHNWKMENVKMLSLAECNRINRNLYLPSYPDCDKLIIYPNLRIYHPETQNIVLASGFLRSRTAQHLRTKKAVSLDKDKYLQYNCLFPKHKAAKIERAIFEYWQGAAYQFALENKPFPLFKSPIMNLMIGGIDAKGGWETIARELCNGFDKDNNVNIKWSIIKKAKRLFKFTSNLVEFWNLPLFEDIK